MVLHKESVREQKKAPQIANGEVVQFRKQGISQVRDFGKRIHRTCKKCKKPCKQSSRILLIRCPQFEAKDVK